MNLQILRYLSILALVILSSACSDFNNLRDRGLAMSSPTRGERLGDTERKIEIRVIDRKGQALSGVEVSASTTLSQDRDTTNSNGDARVSVTTQADEEIVFRFEAADLYARTVARDLPRGVVALTMVFEAWGASKVRLAAIEFDPMLP